MPHETPRRSPETTRRSVLKAAAWSTPVVATALAVPLAAASTPGTFALAAAATQIASGTNSVITVTIPASALPITAGTVSLEYRRSSGSGTIISASFSADWTYSWPQPTVLDLVAPSTPPTNSTFSVALSGPGTWSVTLRTPQGDFATQIDVIAPA